MRFFCRNRSDNDALSCSAPLNFRSCHPINPYKSYKMLRRSNREEPYRALCSCAENVRIAVPGRTPETCSPGSSLRRCGRELNLCAILWLSHHDAMEDHIRTTLRKPMETHGNPWKPMISGFRNETHHWRSSFYLAPYRPKAGVTSEPRYFLSAGLSGAVASAATQPLDVVKTRLQTQDCHLQEWT